MQTWSQDIHALPTVSCYTSLASCCLPDRKLFSSGIKIWLLD